MRKENARMKERLAAAVAGEREAREEADRYVGTCVTPGEEWRVRCYRSRRALVYVSLR